MIYFNNLSKSYQYYQSKIHTAIDTVLQSGSYILGEQVKVFEQEFSQYTGCKFCVAVGSGTDALTLSLRAAGITTGDQVITANVTAFPTITAIINAGAIPVVVDINPGNGLIDTDQIESKINSKTKAIVPVHLYGQCCDMRRIMDISQTYSIPVIEDAAQAVGSHVNNKKAGSFGLCGAFSFYPTKNLGCMGDGGAITTNSEDVYKQLLLLRNYGQHNRYYHEIAGTNSRLDEIQAAILRIKLNHLDTWNKRRNEIAALYQSISSVTHVSNNSDGFSNNHLYVVRHKSRNALQQFLLEKNIQTFIHYPVPVNKQHAYLWQKDDHFPVSETFTSEIISLPMYPELENEEISLIIEAINEFK